MHASFRNSIFRSTLFRRNNACRMMTLKRCFSNARVTIQKKEDFDLTKINRPLDKEIEYNNRLLEDEQLNINKVKSKHARILQEQGWEIVDQSGSNLVELKASRGPVSMFVSFDAAYVVQATRSSESMQDAEMEQEEMEEEDRSVQSKGKNNKRNEEEFEDDGFAEENEDQFEDDVTPFTFNIKLANEDALPGKFLNFEVEVLPTELPGKDEISLNNLTLESREVISSSPNGQSNTDPYLGPDYHSLDDNLREQFDGFISKNFKKLVPFIREYSEAKEAKEYGSWLDQIKKIIKH